ncbi:hypothetical protein PVK06_017889 [Gossypium arboreum]|uniref:BZIP domain-containing protein n=1 Tax=Gossypium arboreum TaxID=29729 RepID=A0ABR0Q4E0_GOSAR|nr:hypothetical protein PVK06_017889 [Gossypium arboreum]
MEGYSSNGSTSFFTSEMPDESQLLSQSDINIIDSWFSEGTDDTDWAAINGPMKPLFNYLNQVETSEASCQTKTGAGSGRPKLTATQRRENKRKSDFKYRQNLKKTADEQTAEIKRLKEENESLNAENTRLKDQIGSSLSDGQLQAAAPLRQESFITQSTGKQFQLPAVPVNVVDTIDYIAQNQTRTEAGTSSKNDAAITDILMKLEADDESRVKFSDFTGVHGERMTLGKYSFPPALHPIVNNIIDIYGDVSATSKMNPSIAETVYIMFSQNQTRTEAGTSSNNDAAITDILMKLEADDESRVKFSDFTGLHGERMTLGKYSFPPALHPIVNNIIDVYGDVSATSKMNPSITETVYNMFCASVKEMSNLRLEQVTEDLILKWRDVIKDALRINFKVDFAMEHLKKIACAYIGLTELRKLDNVGLRISKLESELSAEKKEHSKICGQSKQFMDAAEEFNALN